MSANFLYTSWKRFRKYNAYATGITQNVQDCLTNDTAYAMLANSEFVVMLRQTKDIDSVVELYGPSEPQRKYCCWAQPGEGIIKMGNSLIPFNNPQPKDTTNYSRLNPVKWSESYMSENEIRVLYVQPGKYPEERIIPNTLSASQKLVGGNIECCCPWRR